MISPAPPPGLTPVLPSWRASGDLFHPVLGVLAAVRPDADGCWWVDLPEHRAHAVCESPEAARQTAERALVEAAA